MAKKEFVYKGKSLDDLKALSTKELSKFLPAPARRKIIKGFTEQEQIFLKNVASSTKPIETHCRDMIILPLMVGKMVKVHKGNGFADVMIEPEMIGHRLGEFALSRKRVMHNVAGVGAKAAAAAAPAAAAKATDKKK